MIVGFTGTRLGMTLKQIEAFIKLIKEINMKEFHHGDCIGSDQSAHIIVKDVHKSTKIVLHPPQSQTYRAYCEADMEFKALPYLDRNRDIVRISDILIAATSSKKEKLDSGVWSTIRYARRLKKPIYIVNPDGKLKEENIKKD